MKTTLTKRISCSACEGLFTVAGQRTTDSSRTWGVTCPLCGAPNDVDFPNIDGVFRTLAVRPQPDGAFQKPNGKWTFFIYPEGRPIEAGVFASKAEAADASAKALLVWETNLWTYGPIAALTR